MEEAHEDKRVLAAKACSNIYTPLYDRLGIGQLNGRRKISVFDIYILNNIKK